MNITTLKKEIIEIEKDIDIIDSLISKYNKISDYKLVTTKGNGYYQYSYRDRQGSLQYIPSSRIDLAREIAEKEYLQKLKQALLNQRYAIVKFLKSYDPTACFQIYNRQSIGRKKLFQSFYKSDDEYVSEWLEIHKESQNPIPITNSYLTNRGDYVRSKSEKILADLFYKYDIPYQYEPEFRFGNGLNCYPDFVLLNVKERKTYYWEHFGLTSSKEYADKNLDKLAKYEKEGVVLGDNLIVSFESAGVNLDVNLIEEKIKKYLV